MIKKDKNFRLTKTVKRMMAGKYCKNVNEFKNLMIHAQIFSTLQPPKTSKKQKENSTV
jgi:hypothetical protein